MRMVVLSITTNKWEENSAKVEKKKVPLTFQEFKALRNATINLGKLTEEEPADFLLHYFIKASENEIARYNPFPGGGGDNRVSWVRSELGVPDDKNNNQTLL